MPCCWEDISSGFHMFAENVLYWCVDFILSKGFPSIPFSSHLRNRRLFHIKSFKINETVINFWFVSICVLINNCMEKAKVVRCPVFCQESDLVFSNSLMEFCILLFTTELGCYWGTLSVLDRKMFSGFIEFVPVLPEAVCINRFFHYVKKMMCVLYLLHFEGLFVFFKHLFVLKV